MDRRAGLGDYDNVLSAYESGRIALPDTGAEPPDATRQLIVNLQR